MRRRLLTTFALAVALSACGPKAKTADAGGGDTNLAAAKTFMTKNATAPGVHVTASGLQYKIVRSGPAAGMRPQQGDLIKVHYEGKLLDGKVFDSSYERGVPAVLPLDGLIPGWIEALQLMRPGDEWILYVPPGLGYGAEDKGEIPPNSALVFRIELIAVQPGPGRVGQG
jgi:peptidylprolyl isomerase/FKBP-type peptidyl-prolyl cis-trans isomerase FklB